MRDSLQVHCFVLAESKFLTLALKRDKMVVERAKELIGLNGCVWKREKSKKMEQISIKKGLDVGQLRLVSGCIKHALSHANCKA